MSVEVLSLLPSVFSARGPYLVSIATGAGPSPTLGSEWLVQMVGTTTFEVVRITLYTSRVFVYVRVRILFVT